jgi:hypothetical protein
MSDSRSAPPMEAPIPPQISVVRDAEVLTIIYRWFQPLDLIRLAGSVVFCGIGFSFVRKNWQNTASLPWFGLIFMGFGLCMVYSSLAGLLNQTRVVVKSGNLWVRQGPLPWFGDAFIPADRIHRLYREDTVSSGSGFRFRITGSNSSPAYYLRAILRDGRKIQLMRSMPTPDLTLYLEQEIEKALGIKDRR